MFLFCVWLRCSIVTIFMIVFSESEAWPVPRVRLVYAIRNQKQYKTNYYNIVARFHVHVKIKQNLCAFLSFHIVHTNPSSPDSTNNTMNFILQFNEKNLYIFFAENKNYLHSFRITHNFHFPSSCYCVCRLRNEAPTKAKVWNANEKNAISNTKWEEMSQNEIKTTTNIINLPSITCNLLNGINVSMRKARTRTHHAENKCNLLQHALAAAIFIGTILIKDEKRETNACNCRTPTFNDPTI